ncbi:hypothetical protein [Larkinella rosea]|uniref:Uncharacterized protein n=1 Tax=Larkinella rosea TaxID=2025312 RepID=A0A3P1BPQ0_9BACT|nr:hypothetical protein [Larkinella rosea]RRB02836.1 hypothetical protein EHT25_20575 [Larkinella rosea]
MKQFRIEIFKMLCLSNNQYFPKASFKDTHIGDGYGEKRFITELGEVAYVIFFENDGIPIPMQNISSYVSIVLKKQTNPTWVGFNEAIRYFADLSMQGKVWYMDAMYYHEKCYVKDRSIDTRIIDRHEITVINQPITYHKWLSLSHEEKIKYMSYLFNNPISVNYPILNHPFWDIK